MMILGRDVKRSIAGFLYPEAPRCLCCGTEDDALAYPWLVCDRCTQELNELDLTRGVSSGLIRRPVEGLSYVACAFVYQGAARELVHQLKYSSNRAAAIPLAERMLLLPSEEEELLVPIPTTGKRLRERGFNQSELLARHLSKTFGMPMDEKALYRIDERPSQASLSAEERRTNLMDCMRAKPNVADKRILLIDDVYTTGATVCEAARALHEAGAASVGMLAACKAGQLSDA